MTRLPVTICCAPYLGLLCACATADRPPDTLLQARAAYANAEHSPAASFDPAGLNAARSSLDQAESLFDDHAESWKVETAAYVAMRRAQRAKLEGETSRLQLRVREAQAQAKQLEWPSTRDDRADDAIRQLHLAPGITLIEQDRSVVIRLPCSELFGAQHAQLSAAALETLDKIAPALKEQGDRRILIVGYTDSGTADDKLELSKRRAEAVANYLIARGVPREKLAARGLGANNPIASNQTAAGRADNARVEILVRMPPKDYLGARWNRSTRTYSDASIRVRD
jgi:outer membrane protein OmpA-like peptidoglycan-associated protein